MQPQEGTGNLDIQIKNHKGYRKRLADYVVQLHRSSTVTFMQNNMEYLFFCLSAPPFLGWVHSEILHIKYK